MDASVQGRYVSLSISFVMKIDNVDVNDVVSNERIYSTAN